MSTPVFHTKTIQSLLSPLAERIDNLVEIYQQAEQGSRIEAIDHLVINVKNAVSQLQSVGKQTVEECDDNILKIDMPPALGSITTAVASLDQASENINLDSSSEIGRLKLIEGARLILTGTSDVLKSYDEFQVRQIIKVCNQVIKYLDYSLQIISLEQFEIFMTNLRPGLSKINSQVGPRADDLVSENVAKSLKHELLNLDENMKCLEENIRLCCQILTSGNDETAKIQVSDAHKDVITCIQEIIRLLKLKESVGDKTTDWLSNDNFKMLEKKFEKLKNVVDRAKDWIFDEEDDDDNNDSSTGFRTDSTGEGFARLAVLDGKKLAIMAGNSQAIIPEANDVTNNTDILISHNKNVENSKNNTAKSLNNLVNKAGNILDEAENLDRKVKEIYKLLPVAQEWLADVEAKPSEGSEAVYKISTLCAELAASNMKNDNIRNAINAISRQITENMSTLEKIRQAEQGRSQDAIHVSFLTGELLKKMLKKLDHGLNFYNPNETFSEKLIKIDNFLQNPEKDVENEYAGREATDEVIRMGWQAMSELDALVTSIDGERENKEIKDLKTKLMSEANSAGRNLASLIKNNNETDAVNLADNINEIKANLETSIVYTAIDKCKDINTVIKNLEAAAKKGSIDQSAAGEFKSMLNAFNYTNSGITNIARQAAEVSSNFGKSDIREINNFANKIDKLAKRVENASKLLNNNPEDPNLQNHFSKTASNWKEETKKLVELIDNSTDSFKFISAIEKRVISNNEKSNKAMFENLPHNVLPLVLENAQLAQRALYKTKLEADNSEDKIFVENVRSGFDDLQKSIGPTVNEFKNYASSQDASSKSDLKMANQNLADGVTKIRTIFEKEMMIPDTSEENDAFQEISNEPTTPTNKPDIDQEMLRKLALEEAESNKRKQLASINFVEDETANQDIQEGARELLNDIKRNEPARNKPSHKTDINNTLALQAKHMAVLFAKMAQLVNGDNRSELIKCSKDIAIASNEISRLGNIIADECTDSRLSGRLRTELNCIPTIATQLKILSTVKATSMGRNAAAKEVDDAMETLILNAKNLMRGVGSVVNRADACTVKILATNRKNRK